MSEPTTEAGKRLLADIRELAAAFHEVGSIRDHADPKDRTGWNVHGIETCEDVYCVDALAADKDIAAIEAEARAAALDALAARVNDEADIRLPDGRLAIARSHLIVLIAEAKAYREDIGHRNEKHVDPPLDEERLARALRVQMPWRYDTYEPDDEIGPIDSRLDAAAIAKAYREDTDAQ